MMPKNWMLNKGGLPGTVYRTGLPGTVYRTGLPGSFFDGGG
jgi:hypothetical protein